MNISKGLMAFGLVIGFVFVVEAGENVWKATSAGRASVAANWSLGRVPNDADTVVFDSTSVKNCEWDADATRVVAGWQQKSGYTGTVTVDTTYDNTFPKLTVTGDMAVNAGSLTHLANPGPGNGPSEQYRLKLEVGGTFTIGSSGSVDLSLKGCYDRRFPNGGAVGGYAANSAGYDTVYGNVYEPYNLGAGGNSNNGGARAGGGAFWLECAGAVTIDGKINVRGYQANDTANAGCGSVYIKAASCGGSGEILANFATTSYANGALGSGGRVAIVLTSASALDFDYKRVRINGVCAGSSGGGGGTFYLKVNDPAQPYGTLYLDDSRSKGLTVRWQTPTAITAIPPRETWKFDAIKISRYGMLAVPPSTKLVLPNGPQSVNVIEGGPNGQLTQRTGGILGQGGVIDFGERSTYIFDDAWIFQANSNQVFNGNVIVRNGAALGCLRFSGADLDDAVICDITVNGKLTVESDGYLWAEGGGPELAVSTANNAYHGGQPLATTGQSAYDSILDPMMPGMTITDSTAARTQAGGGVLKFDVKDELKVDGVVNANGLTASGTGYSGAPGGTVNIRAKSLSGEGSITANSAVNTAGTGGGGRVAIRLTDGEFGTKGVFAAIEAKGATQASGTAATSSSSSAGTVYLESGSDRERAGQIYVDNDGTVATTAVTPFPAAASAGLSDAADDFASSELFVRNRGYVKFFANLRLASLVLDATGRIDLNGKTITVARGEIGTAVLRAGSTYQKSALGANVFDSVGGGKIVVQGQGLSVIYQ